MRIIAEKRIRLLVVCAGVFVLALAVIGGLTYLSAQQARAEAARQEAARQEELKRKAEKKASAVADLQVMLKNDPFMTYDAYRRTNPEKLTLAEFDAVWLQPAFANARETITTLRQRETELRAKAKRKEAAWKTGQAVTYNFNGVELKMLPCPAGTFLMGSPSGEKGRDDDEAEHRVTISKPFLIGKYEVTQGQWQAVMGDNPSHFKGDDRPVEQVSWNDAKLFCDKLNELLAGKLPEGYRFDLPTEAQWEYACRAGTTTALNSGKDLTSEKGTCPNLDEVGWYGENSGRSTHPVEQKRPNAWGIYDMHGNVWEWCRDWKGDYSGDATDPTGPVNGSSRALRGGSWINYASYCRSAYRFSLVPGYRNYYLGFRLALVPVQ